MESALLEAIYGPRSKKSTLMTRSEALGCYLRRANGWLLNPCDQANKFFWYYGMSFDGFLYINNIAAISDEPSPSAVELAALEAFELYGWLANHEDQAKSLGFIMPTDQEFSTFVELNDLPITNRNRSPQ